MWEVQHFGRTSTQRLLCEVIILCWRLILYFHLDFFSGHSIASLEKQKKSKQVIMSDMKSAKQELHALAPQLDLESVGQHRPTYELTRLTQNNGADSAIIGLTAGVQSEFIIPAVAWNPAESVLNFTATIPATAATYTWMPRDTFPCIDSIQVQNVKGTNIADIRFAAQYLKAVGKLEMTYERLQTQKKEALLQKCAARPAFAVAATDAKGTVKLVDDGKDVYVSSASIADTSAGGAVDKKINAAAGGAQVSVSVTGLVTDVNALRYNKDEVDNPFTENLYLSRSSAQNTDLVIYFKIPLRDLAPDSLLSMDKDLYVGEPLRLLLNWAPGINWGWTAPGAYDPATTAADLTVTPTITDLRLFYAQERNERVISTLMAKFAAGTLHYTIPYPQCFNNRLQSSSAHNVTLRMNAGNGRRLKRIVHCMISGNEVKNNRYEISRITAGTQATATVAAVPGTAKAGYYYTQVDGRNRQQFNITMDQNKNEDYMLMYPHLKGTAIQSLDQFKYNWVHVESFDEVGSIADRSSHDDQIRKGVDLAGVRELKWDFSLTLTGGDEALSHYSFAVFERDLKPTPRALELDGIMG